MDGSDRAAVLADQAQAILAGIRSDAERYVRVKLAGRILRDQIERYRSENQGRLIRRASEHFAALTTRMSPSSPAFARTGSGSMCKG